MIPALAYTYRISSNGTPGDWYWEVTNQGEIIGRGVAATEALARADAIRAALRVSTKLPTAARLSAT